MMSNLRYKNSWQIEETYFNEEVLPKFESLMAQGNGYLEMRNNLEETYQTGTKGLFVTGVFNQYSDQEVTELANFPDISSLVIKINNERVNLKDGTTNRYNRKIDYSNGETVREFVWVSNNGIEIECTFKRFVSKANKHLIVNQVSLLSNQDCLVEFSSGIDGRITNSGSQHFEEGEKRYHRDQFLQLLTETSSTKIPVSINCVHRLNMSSRKQVIMNRRRLIEKQTVELKADTPLEFTKYSLIYTGRDKEFSEKNFEQYLRISPVEQLTIISKQSYSELFNESANEWRKIWQKAPISISSKDFKDELMLNFARYHIHAMSPVHDNRMNIGAKGMSGEGYKGHTFWDTEIFLLPYFTYNYPESAKHLIEYRVNSLEAAKENARKNGFNGAQYPWESAWITDGEVTPKFGGIDVISGKPTPVLTGDLEHHVTGDVVFGASDYISITGDKAFKEKILPMVIESAKFWSTRVVWNITENRYEIKQVIGPDEYTEHVDNNAYTNYIAKYTLDLALDYIEEFSAQSKNYINNEEYELLSEVSKKIYLPKPNQDCVIPQDNTFLSKEIIDLEKYHKTDQVLTILNDYNMEQINELQVLKQADIILLLLLFPDQFSDEVKKANWNYYFPKTLHDSSLSKSTHCNFALKLGEVETAYDLFKSNFKIDLCNLNMNSSDDGVHAASLGGIWQNVVLGFGGLRISDGKLFISPKLPKNWDKLEYVVKFKQRNISVAVSHDRVDLSCDDSKDSEIEFFFNNQKKVLKDKLTLYC